MFAGHSHIKALIIVDFHIHCLLFFLIFFLVDSVLVLSLLQWLYRPLSPFFHPARCLFGNLVGLVLAPNGSLLGKCPLKVLDHLLAAQQICIRLPRVILLIIEPDPLDLVFDSVVLDPLADDVLDLVDDSLAHCVMAQELR